MAGCVKSLLKEASNSLRLRRASHHSYSNPQHKVSHKDSHPCRKVSQHSELTSYQQLHKASLTEVISRVERQGVQHLHHDRRPAN